MFFLGRLISAPQRTFRLILRGTMIIVMLYMICEVLALSFACDLPRTWDGINGQCFNMTALWDFDAAFDILTSLVILGLPVIIIQPLQMRTSRKLQAVAAFAFQLPPCAFAIVRLVYLHRALDSNDQTWHAVDWQVWTQINMHFSVVAANMPCLKIFLEGFQSVLFRQEMSSQVEQTELRSYQRSKQHSKSRERDARWGELRSARSNKSIFRPDDGESSTAINGPRNTQQTPSLEMVPLSDHSGEGRIYKTTEWTVLESEIGSGSKR